MDLLVCSRAEVQRIVALLEGILATDVLWRYDPAELGGLYPAGFWGAGGSPVPGGVNIQQVLQSVRNASDAGPASAFRNKLFCDLNAVHR